MLAKPVLVPHEVARLATSDLLPILREAVAERETEVYRFSLGVMAAIASLVIAIVLPTAQTQSLA